MLRPQGRHQPDAALPAGRRADLRGPDSRRPESSWTATPAAIAVGLTTDAGPGGRGHARPRVCRELAEVVGVPVCNASEADHAALTALGARRVCRRHAVHRRRRPDRPGQRRGGGLRGGRHQGHRGAFASGHLRDPARRHPQRLPRCRPERLRCRPAGRHRPSRGCPARRAGKRDGQAHRRVQRRAVYWQTLRAAGIDDRIVPASGVCWPSTSEVSTQTGKACGAFPGSARASCLPRPEAAPASRESVRRAQRHEVGSALHRSP